MKAHYRLFLLCFFSVALGAMDSVLASAYLPDIVRELTGQTSDTATGRVGSWVNFAFLAGATLGGIILGFLSDRIGRRAVLILALLSYGSGSALGAIAPGWEILAATRVLVGAGVGAVFFVGALVVWFGGYGNPIFAFSMVYLAGLPALFFVKPR